MDCQPGDDELTFVSAVSFLVLLADLNLFMYNPLHGRASSSSCHNLAELEIIDCLAKSTDSMAKKIQEQIFEKVGCRSFQAIIPYFQSFLVSELDVFDHKSSSVAAKELNWIITNYYATKKNDHKLLRVKTLIEEAFGQFLAGLQDLGGRVSLTTGVQLFSLLMNFRHFEPLLPKGSVARLVIDVLDLLVKRWTELDGCADEPKLFVVLLAQYTVSEDRVFCERLSDKLGVRRNTVYSDTIAKYLKAQFDK